MVAESRCLPHFFLVRSAVERGTFRALVIDSTGRAHRPLSWFVPFAAERYAPSTVTTYLHALIRYFSWLANERQQWDKPPDMVRAQCGRFLNQTLHCQIRKHRQGFFALTLTKSNASQVSGFLAACRLFYQFALEAGLYAYAQPLERLRLPDTDVATASSHPRMPAVSGVEEPVNVSGRLTDSYFVIVNERWVPQLIDEPLFPRRILDAGAQAGWKLRERVVTRLLFEAGPRISEVCGLTLGDWYARGLRCEAAAFSKGSYQRRVKTLRFSEPTAKLLRQYFDEERRQWDPHDWRLADYLQHGDPATWQTVPLFLTTQGTALTASTFRDLYWRPACQRSGIVANIHQMRHWYVTFAMREISETVPDGPEKERRLQELIVYMGWRSGRATLSSYDHHFKELAHSDVQARLHAKLDHTLRKTEGMPAPVANDAPEMPIRIVPFDPEWRLLRRLGHSHDA